MMTVVVFYEKTGCVNNTRQKAWLTTNGYRVEARDLLREPWTAERLRAFFGSSPVAEWFNRSAPLIKDGSVVPENLSAQQALELMLSEPLLIRRPLLEVDGRRCVGFEPRDVGALFELDVSAEQASEACPRRDGHSCSQEDV